MYIGFMLDEEVNDGVAAATEAHVVQEKPILHPLFSQAQSTWTRSMPRDVSLGAASSSIHSRLQQSVDSTCLVSPREKILGEHVCLFPLFPL